MIAGLPRTTRHAGVVAVVVAVAVMAAGRVGWAVDDEVVAEREAQPDESNTNFIPLDTQFDQLVFNNQPGWTNDVQTDNNEDPAAGRLDVIAVAARIADGRLGSIKRICGLSQSQARALRLAMESDIRRMAEVVARERARYEGVVVDLNDPTGQRRYNLLQQDANRVRERVSGLFESGSLFRKTLGAVLDESQAGKLAGSRDQQRGLLWRSLVLNAMLELDDRLGLDQSQADALERLLMEKVPPLRVDPVPPEMEQQHIQQMLVYSMLAQADQRRLKDAVSARQWRALSQFIQQGRANMPHLRQQGLLEKTEK